LLDNLITNNKNKININNFKNHYYNNRTFHSNSRENLILKSEIIKNKIIYLNREDYLCDLEHKECHYITDDFRKIFYDYGHYTLDGAKFLGEQMHKISWFRTD
jgi:hypothetical protein